MANSPPESVFDCFPPSASARLSCDGTGPGWVSRNMDEEGVLLCARVSGRQISGR